MPLDAPVTTATFPSSFAMSLPPVGCLDGTRGMIEVTPRRASTHLFVSAPRAGAISMRQNAYGCGLEAALAVIGGKWKPIILWHLTPEARRFGVLRRLVT